MKIFAYALAGVVATTVAAQAQLIDFTSFKLSPMTGDAVLGTPNDVAWNELNPDNGGTDADTITNVKDSNGNTTTVGISAVFHTQFTGDSSSDGNLLPNLFDFGLGSQDTRANTLDFSGLSDNTTYTLVLYGNNLSGNRGFTVTGGGANELFEDDPATTLTSILDSATTASSGITTYAGNYVEFSATSDATGNLDLTITGTGGEIDLAGGQIEAAPEPRTDAMMIAGVAMLGLLAYCRRGKFCASL